MKRQILLGLGAGQCGTRLLADILNRQPGTRVTHEEPPLLPWKAQPGTITERLKRILATRKEPIVGDVASFYLPYLEEAIQFDPNIRLICLRRPEDEVVAGFCRFLEGSSPFAVNHWAEKPAPGWQHDPLWSRVFPHYDIQDREEGIRHYWREYYERAEELTKSYPNNLRIWDTEILTTEQGVREALSFAGFPERVQVILTGRRQEPATQAAPVNKPQRHPQDPKNCVILVPFTVFIHQECDDALKELERRGYRVWRVGGYAAIDQGRNQMATDALLEGFAETLWIDADVAFHPDSVDRLRSHPYGILCGIYPQKGKRALACHVMPGSPSMVFGKRGGLTEILYAGAGFLLIRREVYLSVQHKLGLPVCNERFGRPTIPFFQPMVRSIEESHWYLAEDYAFCQRARECGYKVFADTSIRLWHIGQHRYGWEDAGLERQRFGNFTLNFSKAPDQVHETPTERPPALSLFAAEYPWPQEKPEARSDYEQNRLPSEAQELISGSITPETRLIVLVGSQAARFVAGLAPQAHLMVIDTWEDNRLYQTLLSECWNYRDRIIPIKAQPHEALERIGEAGLKPDLVYLGSQSDVEQVSKQLAMALDLFPESVLVGTRLDQETLRHVIESVVRDRGITLQCRGAAWCVRPGGLS